MAIDTKKYQKKLLEEKQELIRLQKTEEETRKPVELDQTAVGRLSRMDAMQVHEMAMEAQRRRDMRIHQIDAALKRMDEGEYGYCVKCGEEIAAGRLDVNPVVAACINCS